jgi:ATP-dependent DNA ligase
VLQIVGLAKEGRIRHPSFKGLREDKPAKDVKRERAAGPQ